jgi:hypothetical protein
VKSTLCRSEFANRSLLKLQEILHLNQERRDYSAITSHVTSDTAIIDKFRLSLVDL